MYIYLTRHGETNYNKEGKTQGITDTSLSPRGIHQAEVLADRLYRENLTAVFSSSLERAYRTAVVIGDKVGIPPEKRDELQEISFGDWEGLTLEQIEQRFPGQLAARSKDYSFTPQGGESLLSVRNRVQRFLSVLEDRGFDADSRVLIVSHAYTIRILLVHLMGLPLEYMFDFRLDNTGISIIQTGGERNRIVCLNDTCHLHKI
jgi:broad specificity phosphatase PhoE